MGLCLSCLRGSSDDEDLNETSSLLRNHQNVYSNDYIQEAELLKQQQRQQELNTIVNDLSDNLIDVSTFLNTTGTGPNSQLNTPVLSHSNANSLHLQTTNDDSIADLGDGQFKSFPHLYTSDEKARVQSETEALSDGIKDACKINFTEPLYLRL